MNRLRKHIAAAVLLALVILPLLYAAWLAVQQQQIQRQMEKHLETAALHTIKMPISAMHWIRPGQELLVDGRLFDVKSMVQVQDAAILTGLFDQKETAVTNQIEQQANQRNTPSQEAALAFLLLPLYNNTSMVNIEPPCTVPAKPGSGCCNELCSLSATVPTPPPDSFSV